MKFKDFFRQLHIEGALKAIDFQFTQLLCWFYLFLFLFAALLMEIFAQLLLLSSDLENQCRKAFHVVKDLAKQSRRIRASESAHTIPVQRTWVKRSREWSAKKSKSRSSSKSAGIVGMPESFLSLSLDCLVSHLSGRSSMLSLHGRAPPYQ